MSTQTLENKDTFVPIPLDQLNYYWIHDGMVPVFTANVSDICKHIEAHGFQIYYVIATEKYKVDVSTTYSKVEERPQVFRVNNTIVGKSIVPAGEDIKFDKIEASAWFNLPRIPYYLIQKLDDFFRLIDSQLGTESIVILTYDTSKSGPEGWGVAVPDQANTAADCDYDPQSIIDELPEGVWQVGSVHSHPGMAAYASGTDHKDQANFDGIHITFGWMKTKNNGATEYHIELQLGGKSFGFTPSQVFDSAPAREPSEDVKEWAKKVTKKAGWQGTGGNTGTSQKTGSHHMGFTQPGIPSHNLPKSVKLPDSCPDPEKNIIIAVISDSDNTCPFCDTQMISVDRKKRRCMSCHMYLCYKEDTIENIIDARTRSGVYTQDIDIARGSATKPIYKWIRMPDNINRYDKVFEPQGK